MATTKHLIHVTWKEIQSLEEEWHYFHKRPDSEERSRKLDVIENAVSVKTLVMRKYKQRLKMEISIENKRQEIRARDSHT